MTDKDKIVQLKSTMEAIIEARDKAEKICEIACRELVLAFFDGNENKTKLWFKTDNPMLGGISAQAMIDIGRAPKLLQFVVEQMCDHIYYQHHLDKNK